jgi:glycosyltransferase involved in cell wall biosynthesis
MRVVVANNMTPFIHGGAEELANRLVRGIAARGHEVELIRIPFRWAPYALIPKQVAIARQVRVDSADLLIALKFPAYGISHHHKNLWLLHQYRQAYDLFDAGYTNIPADADGDVVRNMIRLGDAQSFSEARTIYTNSPITSARLQHYNGIGSEVLYPPLNDPELFAGGGAGTYVFAGGRVDSLKRQELLIRALKKTPERVRLVIAGPLDSAGTGDRLRAMVEELDVADRVTLDLRFLERSEIAALVNGAAACAYIPYDEDSLGYVSMEAAQAHKPVITTTDSGGILGLVKHGETGWVVEPNEDQLADAMTEAVTNHRSSRALGSALFEHWQSFGATWTHTIDRLLE